MKEHLQKAKEQGAMMARKDRVSMGGRIAGYNYSVFDNPWCQRNRKKEHIAWHNAFYKECVLLGRNVTNRMAT